MRRALLPVIGFAVLVIGGRASAAANGDGIASWHQVESVLASPRCLNCHTVTDYPRQGDDRHRHNFEVIRGAHGTGAPAFACAACHHAANNDASGVPGAVGWRLPPLSMAWESRPGVPMTSPALCTLLVDPSRNGGRTPGQLVEHHAQEPLVRWAWSPGRRADGSQRQPPPISHEQFVQATRAWVAAGAPCP